MRTTLIGWLVANVRYNHARKLARIRVFEVGRVFLRDAAAAGRTARGRGLAPADAHRRRGLRPGAEEQWGEPARAVDFFDVKADLEALCAPRRLRFEAAAHPALHPGRSARILVEGAGGLDRRAASALAAEVRAAAGAGAVRARRGLPHRCASAEAFPSRPGSRR